mmetsp:Transcript_12627/g.34011  ORF Transcript_12627/g.34011 Transcript_12627/m.34011 type:complete len:372 (+) Transcript_12627:51-1166(+)
MEARPAFTKQHDARLGNLCATTTCVRRTVCYSRHIENQRSHLQNLGHNLPVAKSHKNPSVNAVPRPEAGNATRIKPRGTRAHPSTFGALRLGGRKGLVLASAATALAATATAALAVLGQTRSGRDRGVGIGLNGGTERPLRDVLDLRAALRAGAATLVEGQQAEAIEDGACEQDRRDEEQHPHLPATDAEGNEPGPRAASAALAACGQLACLSQRHELVQIFRQRLQVRNLERRSLGHPRQSWAVDADAPLNAGGSDVRVEGRRREGLAFNRTEDEARSANLPPLAARWFGLNEAGAKAAPDRGWMIHWRVHVNGYVDLLHERVHILESPRGVADGGFDLGQQHPASQLLSPEVAVVPRDARLNGGGLHHK